MQDEYMTEEIPEKQFNKKEARKLFSRLGFGLAMFLMVTMVFQMVFSLLIETGCLVLGNHAFDKAMVISMGVMYLLGFPVFFLLMKRIPVTERIPKQKWSFWKLAGTFLICLSIVYIGNMIGQFLMFLVSQIIGRPMYNAIEDLVNHLNPWLVLLITVILAPVVEEIMFRKLLIDRIVHYGQGVAVVASGVLFGLVHGNFYQFFYACALGMIFAYIYVKTGRLGYTILFHLLINFIGSMVPLGLLKAAELQPVLGVLLFSTFGLFVLGFMITGVVLLICFRKQITWEAGSITIPRGSRFSVMFLNVGMVLYVVICTVMFVIG